MKYRGFTLIELLVVISIIALLLAILMPALSRTKELAKRLRCGSNLHSIGVSLQVYESDHDSVLPRHYDRWGPKKFTYSLEYLEPWVSYVVYHSDITAPNGAMKAIQLGTLFEAGIIDNPKAFYCISQPRSGANLVYTYGYYTDKGTRKWGSYLPIKSNGNQDDKIRSSYHYWLHGNRSLSRLSKEPVVFDNIQHWDSVAHTHNRQPHGVNALFGDGHVNYTSNDSMFELDLWNGGPAAGPWDGPGNSRELFEKIIERLEP